MHKNSILITGAAQRIGYAAALHLRQLGYSVIITYRREKPSLKSLKDAGVTCVQADFSSAQGIENLCQWIKQNVTSLRALIHNASLWQSENEYGFSNDLLNTMYQIHVAAPYHINHACCQLLKSAAKHSATGFTDIIHITDYTVERGSKNHLAYCASKAALANLTLSFAKLYAPYCKVNSIAPSLIVFNANDSEEYKQKTLAKSALSIEPGEAEVVNTIEYILNSQYMTGREVKLDGGRHLLG